MRQPLVLVLTLLAGVTCDRPTEGPSSTTSAPNITVTDTALTHVLTVSNSGYAEPMELAILDVGAWRVAWLALHGGVTPDQPAPAVDFAREMLVLVALGERRTGGYAVRIDDVTAEGSGAVVHYTTTAPGAGCMTTDAIAAPADAVRVPRAAGAIRFVQRTVRQPC